ncbi:endo-1,4-beta-xylanase S20-like isoform X2 [Jatropha curcas]|uniref:endo-1,4-beta-xylanase S20-like isoform X2 n=1 Tax=Jatropha curcas TaxID=180498 RepID=UPI001894D814|nr:endo-1,4-beta-xylanase S20-like isoform X2 [Jatropha curcas]
MQLLSSRQHMAMGSFQKFRDLRCLLINFQTLVHRSQIKGLVLEETRKAKQTATTSNAAGTALFTTGSSDNNFVSGRVSNRGSSNQYNRSNNGQKRGQPRNNNKRQSNGGHNHSNGHPQGGQQCFWQQHPPFYSWSAYPPWHSWGQQAWTSPPCPHPTTPWARPPARQSGILGSHPQQAYAA